MNTLDNAPMKVRFLFLLLLITIISLPIQVVAEAEDISKVDGDMCPIKRRSRPRLQFSVLTRVDSISHRRKSLRRFGDSIRASILCPSKIEIGDTLWYNSLKT